MSVTQLPVYWNWLNEEFQSCCQFCHIIEAILTVKQGCANIWYFEVPFMS